MSEPLSIDSPVYLTAQANGKLVVLTVRVNGWISGYYINFLMRHLHYDRMFGMMDVFYLIPEMRRGTLGIRLFQEMEKEMKARGAEYLMGNARLDNGTAKVFEHLGWEAKRTTYMKKIGGD